MHTEGPRINKKLDRITNLSHYAGMQVIELIDRATGPAFSFEIVPPPRGRSIQDVLEVVDCLMPVKPQWIDVTSHSSSAYFHENKDGTITRKTYRKRPGTLGICGVIQNRYKVDTVAHVLCLGFTREETEDALIELGYLGVENILAIRGDSPNFEKKVSRDRSTNGYAADLVRQIVDLRNGHFLDELSHSTSLNFCVGVAGYPEKHFEAANLEIDIDYLKAKCDAGADYIVSQMFFDNSKFFAFVDACRKAGIKVPILPGLKVLKSPGQLKSVPRTFHIDLPSQLAQEIRSNPDHAEEIGIRWAAKQTRELLEKGFKNVHYYVMNDAHLVRKAIELADR
ncbi:MAG: methylenetetrahydrofolate reductase [Bdellovibrionales bacterium]